MSWKVGDVKITKVVELEVTGGTRFLLPQATYPEVQKLEWLIPDFANADGKLRMSIHSLVVETPTRCIIVDTGLGNDKQGRGVPAWNNLHGPFLQDLAMAGYAPDSIDTVLCTHLHVDHVGWDTKLIDGQWVPTFKNARYVFGRAEYEHWTRQAQTPTQAALLKDSVEPIADAGLVDLIASDHRLTDEITMIPTPGHSPGHMSVHIRSAGEEAVLIGDVAHHPVQMSHLDWSTLADFDGIQAAKTRSELLARFTDTPVLVIGGHFDAGYIKRHGESFRFVAA
jgi:glyoxylase-like metal-dependent hydrolase (beta-lactamase superfamily II)